MFDNDSKILTKKESKELLKMKGYQEATFRDFEKDYKNIKESNQVSACRHNLTKFLKITNNGKFYFIEGSPALQVRAWII